MGTYIHVYIYIYRACAGKFHGPMAQPPYYEDVGNIENIDRHGQINSNMEKCENIEKSFLIGQMFVYIYTWICLSRKAVDKHIEKNTLGHCALVSEATGGNKKKQEPPP